MLTLRKHHRPLTLLSGPLNLAAIGRAARNLRTPRQPIVLVAQAPKGARALLPASGSEETAALKQRIAELEAQLATAQAAQAALTNRAHREARVAAITLHEQDNRAAYAAKTARRATPPKVTITTTHVDVS